VLARLKVTEAAVLLIAPEGTLGIARIETARTYIELLGDKPVFSPSTSGAYFL
jgi:hypothetical protein